MRMHERPNVWQQSILEAKERYEQRERERDRKLFRWRLFRDFVGFLAIGTCVAALYLWLGM